MCVERCPMNHNIIKLQRNPFSSTGGHPINSLSYIPRHTPPNRPNTPNESRFIRITSHKTYPPSSKNQHAVWMRHIQWKDPIDEWHLFLYNICFPCSLSFLAPVWNVYRSLYIFAGPHDTHGPSSLMHNHSIIFITDIYYYVFIDCWRKSRLNRNEKQKNLLAL